MCDNKQPPEVTAACLYQWKRLSKITTFWISNHDTWKCVMITKFWLVNELFSVVRQIEWLRGRVAWNLKNIMTTTQSIAEDRALSTGALSWISVLEGLPFFWCDVISTSAICSHQHETHQEVSRWYVLFCGSPWFLWRIETSIFLPVSFP